jgi:hypothetical protein
MALVAGLLFLAALVTSFFVKLTSLDAYMLLQVTKGFAALILVGWGLTRLITGNRQDYRVGQDTLNFVVAVVAATVALMALVK